MDEHLAQRGRAGDVAPQDADRLRQRPDLDVDPAVEVEMVDRAATVAAQHPRRVGVVDEDDGLRLFGRLDDRRQRGDVAIHREHAIGDDQDRPLRAAVRGPQLAEGGPQRIGIPVGEDLPLGLGQPNAVDDAGVVQLVGDDDRALAGQDRDGAGVGREP